MANKVIPVKLSDSLITTMRKKAKASSTMSDSAVVLSFISIQLKENEQEANWY